MPVKRQGQKGNVRFIRKNGRIIPIKQKGSVTMRDDGKVVTKSYEKRRVKKQSAQTGMKVGAVAGALGAASYMARSFKKSDMSKRSKVALGLLTSVVGAAGGLSTGLAAGSVIGKYKASQLKREKKNKK